MKLLALDIGNSNIKVGIFEVGRLIRFWRIVTEPGSPEKVNHQVRQFLNNELPSDLVPDSLVYCTVVPPLEAAIIQPIVETYGLKPDNVLPVIPGQVDVPVDLGGYPADQLGPDRLVNAVAAHAMFREQNVLVVDFGTATTFDVVDAEGNFRGGVIVPGMETFWRILVNRTARLPEVPLKRPPSILGQNTVECLQAGLSAGYLGLYDQIIKQIRAELAGTELMVVMTGGLAEVFQELTGGVFKVDHVDPWLTIKGLHHVYKHARPGI